MMVRKRIKESDAVEYKFVRGFRRNGRRVILSTLLAAGLLAAGIQGTPAVLAEETPATEALEVQAPATEAPAAQTPSTEVPGEGNTQNQDNPGKAITIADATEEFEEGRKVAKGDIKVVDLRGSWREMGRQYGHLMKKELEEVLVFLDIIIESKEGNSAIAQSIINKQTMQTPYRICEFFEGAAETSGLTVEQLQTVNAVERIAGLPQCSVAMAWGDYAASDLVIGRNYDYA